MRDNLIGDNDCVTGMEYISIAADKIYGFIARRGLLNNIFSYTILDSFHNHILLYYIHYTIHIHFIYVYYLFFVKFLCLDVEPYAYIRLGTEWIYR